MFDLRAVLPVHSQFGKVGMTAIGDSRQEADRLFHRTVAVLDKETSGKSHA